MCTKSALNSLNYDVIVSGGGMIGTTLTCSLARNPMLSGKKILLIEGSPKKEWKLQQKYSNRVSSLNEATKQLLTSIGAWKHMQDLRFKHVKTMKVWDCYDGFVQFGSDTSEESVSYIVENDVLISSVEEQLKSVPNVTVFNGRKIQTYKLPTKNGCPVEVTMEDGTKLLCSVLLGADGANSDVRKAMGVRYLHWGYPQSAVVATLHLEEGVQNDTAWQRFLSTGPVALLPLTDKMSSLVWSTTKDKAKMLLQLTNESFVDDLNTAFKETSVKPQIVSAARTIISGVLSCASTSTEQHTPSPPLIKSVEDASRAAFPLGFGHAISYVAPGVALVGDAAHKVHPLAGQGVNLGFGDVQCIVDELSSCVQNGKIFGDISALTSYETKRQLHNIPTMVAIDLMARVYSTTNPALLALGNVALHVANSVTPIKSLMMRQASV